MMFPKYFYLNNLCKMLYLCYNRDVEVASYLQHNVLFITFLVGIHRHHDLSYSMTPGDEVEDMFKLLNEVKRQIPSVTAVSSGAIASDYQRLRVESVCSRLGLVSLAYLWKQDQSFLLQEMVNLCCK